MYFKPVTLGMKMLSRTLISVSSALGLAFPKFARIVVVFSSARQHHERSALDTSSCFS